RYRFTAYILSFEENLAIKNTPPIVNYVSNNWGAIQKGSLFLFLRCIFYSCEVNITSHYW
ncbi:hypothetical protein CN988_20695, partial [Bacillus thuringiensis]